MQRTCATRAESAAPEGRGASGGAVGGATGTAGERRVIFTADDFGRSREINQAVVRAHREGLLTGASLMVSGEAWEEAVELARGMPGLEVGLHVVVADGRAVLPAGDIPHIADASGRLDSSPTRAGLRYFFSRRARGELEREIRAQFARFAATGLPLGHVNGHLQMHVHPSVLAIVVPLAEEFGARGFRIPRDELGPALRRTWGGVMGKMGRYAAMRMLGRRARQRLAGTKMATTERAYGLVQSGHMDEEYVAAVLRGLRVRSAEVFFHPTTGARTDELGPNPGDLEALLSPGVREIVGQMGLVLSSYTLLQGSHHG